MVKRGGLKRKIPIEKIETKSSRGPCYSKRCGGLFSKASQLCLLSGAQIAVLATPMSDNSNVSFFSFGHSSVDTVVSAFLAGKRPLGPSENNDKHMREDMGVCLTRKDLGLGFWWEDETFTKSQNPQELSDAVDSMLKLLEDVKKLRSVDHPHDDVIQKRHHLHGTHEPDQTLTTPEPDLVSHHGTPEPDQTLTTPPISHDFLQNNDTEIMAYSQDFSITDNNKNNVSPVENLDQTLTTYDFLQNTETEIMADSYGFYNLDNNNNALPDDIDMDYDQIIDYGKNSESLLSNDDLLKTSFESFLFDGVFQSTQELQEFGASFLTSSDSPDSMDPTSVFSYSQLLKDGDLVLQNRGFNDDQLHFSDFFNELTPIVTL